MSNVWNYFVHSDTVPSKSKVIVFDVLIGQWYRDA